MKKVILLVACASLFSSFASAQVLIALLFGDKLNSEKLEFGLTLGGNLTSFTNLNEARYKPGISFGLYFTYQINDNLFLHPEAILKSAMGARGLSPYSLGDAPLDSVLSSTEVWRKISYMSVPLLVRYRITGLFFAEAGPQINLRTAAKDDFMSKMDHDKLSYQHSIKDQVTLFDVGIAAGLVWKLKKDKGMSISARYYQGFIDIIKNTSGNQWNSCIQATVSFPVGAGKAAAKRAASQQPNN